MRRKRDVKRPILNRDSLLLLYYRVHPVIYGRFLLCGFMCGRMWALSQVKKSNYLPYFLCFYFCYAITGKRNHPCRLPRQPFVRKIKNKHSGCQQPACANDFSLYKVSAPIYACVTENRATGGTQFGNKKDTYWRTNIMQRFEFLLTDGSILVVYASSRIEAAKKAREIIYA